MVREGPGHTDVSYVVVWGNASRSRFFGADVLIALRAGRGLLPFSRSVLIRIKVEEVPASRCCKFSPADSLVILGSILASFIDKFKVAQDGFSR